MENLTPQQENNPAARVMSVQEMIEVFQMLANLRDDGEGNKTINDLYEQIYLKLGKRSKDDVDKEFSDD